MSTLVRFILVVLLLLSAPLISLYNAYFAHILWDWFAVPVGLPKLSVYQIGGLFFLTGYVLAGLSMGIQNLKSRARLSDPKAELIDQCTTVGIGFLVGPLAIGMAWLYRLYFGA